jgi:hypothetical protein
MLAVVGSSNPVALQFNYWDVDYLFERRLASKLAAWIVSFPLHDSLMAPTLEDFGREKSDEVRVQLEEAYKLFDWTVRNISMESEGASVEDTTLDPRGPVGDDGMGYGYLPWETQLFSIGDFIERGRVFCALADQRSIDSVWISLDGSQDSPGKVWAIGVLIGDDIVIFEPKLGMPILDPDTGHLATLTQTVANERILRRLDLPGQFDYAFTQSDLQNLEFLIDVPPVGASARMKMLEASLLRDERMVLFKDLKSLEERLRTVAPAQTRISVWQTPLLAQIQAASVRERLDSPSPYSMNYMAMHGVWLMDNSAANGRLKHLYGNFENNDDMQGALSLYMDTRVDDLRIEKLSYDPEVQRELGVPRMPGEEREQYQMRVAQMQYILGTAKVDAAYLLAQLHFDRGNFSACESWLQKRVLKDERAGKWWSSGRYLLARAYQELGETEKAAAELVYQPSPQEAGNRLRLRYLRRE